MFNVIKLWFRSYRLVCFIGFLPLLDGTQLLDGITSVVNIQGLKHIAEFGERFEVEAEYVNNLPLFS